MPGRLSREDAMRFGCPPLSLLPPSPSLRQVLQAHSRLVVLGLGTSRAAMGHLLAACAVSSAVPNSSSYSRAVFNQLEIPNVFSYNNFIRCLSRTGEIAEVFDLYNTMRRRHIPSNNYTFPFLIQSCSVDAPQFHAGVQLHAHVLKLGQYRDVFIRNGLVHFYCQCGCMDAAREMFDEMPERRDLVSWNAIIAGYARSGEMNLCHEFFEMMPERDAISWSTMIMGFVRGGDLEKSLSLFMEMIEKGPPPNEGTLVSVLSAAAQLGLLEHGQSIHAAIRSFNFPITLNVATALIDMYAKCGCISSARKLFDQMPRRDVYSWNAMICGLASHGLAQEALQLFESFTEFGFSPTSVTYVGILNACSRAGLVEEGRRHFSAMTEIHKIQPEMEHFGCQVDLLSRAGLIQEALEFISKMKTPPDPVLWATILGACKTHHLFDLGTSIGNKLINLEPEHDGHYILLAGMHAKAGRWEEVRKVRQLMITQRGNSGKVAGWSIIEVQGRVHRFISGDRSHERFLEIRQMLEKIERRLAEIGHLPDVSLVLHDIGEEEKEMAIMEHSERLAMAFGMMVVEEGGIIRIVKNLRVCGDCHEVTKMVSNAFKREIVVRDGSRFHHFKDGRCSCGDYW